MSYSIQPHDNPSVPWKVCQDGFKGGTLHKTREEAEAELARLLAQRPAVSERTAPAYATPPPRPAMPSPRRRRWLGDLALDACVTETEEPATSVRRGVGGLALDELDRDGGAA